MLCSLKWGIYIFFGAWQFIAIFFTLFLVPETRGVPIEEVSPFPPPITSRLTHIRITASCVLLVSLWSWPAVVKLHSCMHLRIVVY